jgi:hypothetical protein
MVTVVPYLLFGSVLAVRLLRRKPGGSGSIAPWAEQSVTREMVWWVRLSLRLVSVAAAFFVPSPPGFWSAGSTFIWALQNGRWAAAVVSAILLGLYSWAVHVLLEAAVAIVRDRRFRQPTGSKTP